VLLLLLVLPRPEQQPSREGSTCTAKFHYVSFSARTELQLIDQLT
jgi:hypothetical protein